MGRRDESRMERKPRSYCLCWMMSRKTARSVRKGVCQGGYPSGDMFDGNGKK
jgi:hypothetical protein